VNLTEKFASWGQTLGQSKGFKSFVTYLREVGPKVASALGGIAAGATAIVVAFAPVGTTVLTIVGKLAGAIAKIPADVLASLATALVGIVVASKLLGPLSFVFEALTSPIGLAAAGAVLLGVGLFELYRNSKPLRRILGDLADFFKTELLPRIQIAATQVVPALKAALKDVNQTLRENRPYLETFGKVLLSVTTAAVIGGILEIAAGIRLTGKAFAIAVPAAKLWADVVLTDLRALTSGFLFFLKIVVGVFGGIIDGAAKAFGWIPGIGGKIKDAQASFHAFADVAIANLTRTGTRLKALQDQIDGIHDKSFKINIANELALVHQLQALQAFRLKDKSFTITANMVERQVGPGGGAGHDPAADPGAVDLATPVPRSVQPSGTRQTQPQSSGRSAPLVNVENMTTTDTDDILRKSQRLARGRNGGGVVLAGSNR